MVYSKRINNLEFRSATYLSKCTPKNISYHINRYYSNGYYGKESEYNKLDDEFYQDKEYPCHKIHKSCFKYSEVCYAIAEFYYNEHEGEYEFMWIGERPLELSPEEDIDFKELINYGFKTLNHGQAESETSD